MPNPANPQDINRFSYVGSNPLRYRDPTGHYYYDEECDCLVYTGKPYNERPFPPFPTPRAYQGRNAQAIPPTVLRAMTIYAENSSGTDSIEIAWMIRAREVSSYPVYPGGYDHGFGNTVSSQVLANSGWEFSPFLPEFPGWEEPTTDYLKRKQNLTDEEVAKRITGIQANHDRMRNTGPGLPWAKAYVASVTVETTPIFENMPQHLRNFDSFQVRKDEAFQRQPTKFGWTTHGFGSRSIADERMWNAYLHPASELCGGSCQ